MPRQIPPSPSPTQSYSHSQSNPSTLVPPLLVTSAAFSFLIFLVTLFRKLTRKRTAPDSDSSSSSPPHRFSYSLLRRATHSFSHRLGQGGFGPVFSGSLSLNQPIAVKVMDSGSLQGEREFHNELFFASKLHSPHVVSVLGFSSDRKRRRMLLVYELLHNGNLQDALLHRKCPELMDWKNRFAIAVDIAKGLQYLHGMDPPVIHGDIKPSNVLLDQNFSAKIGDFGLARLRSENQNQNQCEISVLDNNGSEAKKEEINGHDFGSMAEESESVVSAVFEDISPESVVKAPNSSPETVEPVTRISPGFSDGKETKKKYVMEWIGSEIKNERPKSNWIASSSNVATEKKRKNRRRRLEWWVSMEEEKKEKRRPPREWWKEEYCEELTRKNKKEKNNQMDSIINSDDELYREKKMKMKSRSQRSLGSVDWWLEGLSGELRRSRRVNSHDSAASTTPSMRGTVFYVAPEYGIGDGYISEKIDVYSYGVLLLVLIAGRRPLQVTGSAVSEFQRANLLSWARQLARAGKLVDLVDKSINQSLDKDQAVLCITVALLCLQKSPARRPSMNEVVRMLSGESEPPHLPIELSPSTPSRFPYKSHKKVW